MGVYPVEGGSHEEGPPTDDFSWLSRDTRLKLIELLISTRSTLELSRVLGISPTAVRKYSRGIAAPSDQIIAKILDILAPYEREEAYKMIIDDLKQIVERLYNNLDEKWRSYLKETILAVLK